MRMLALVAAFAVAGCTLFGPEEKPDATRSVTSEDWAQPGATDEQALTDADSCREQARAVVRQDQDISADIASRDAQAGFQDQSPELTSGMNEFESEQRYRRIFEDCMRARGYAPAEE
ncbi:MAG: hypothetical protein BroJett029_18450 [Alphaproteobacteria bacterium]|nr:MAG: hypothetical protein BroJett029_18450 [Alphaproteobacteria bacterium]